MDGSRYLPNLWLMFGLAMSALGLVMVSASAGDPSLAAGSRPFVNLSLIPAVAAQPNQGNQRAAAVRIADASDIRRIARTTPGNHDAVSDLSTYQSMAVAVQSHMRQALDSSPARVTLPAPFPEHEASTASATGPWASPLYPQNGVTLWDRIRVSTSRDRRAFLLGTAIQLHTPLAAATPGVWRGEGRHPIDSAPLIPGRATPPPHPRG